jgi:predicted CXXCH cytochrome family protein
MLRTLTLIFTFFLLTIPFVANAYGPHDPGCTSCHSIHNAKGAAILAVEPNTKEINPFTKSPATGIAALCLGCHKKELGIAPVMLKHSHPVEITPSANVSVPANLIRDGKVTCSSCHDPHPSNPYYKYLIADTGKGSKMGLFCAICHQKQVDKSALEPKKPEPTSKKP